MKHHEEVRGIEGRFVHPIYSPRGEIEGFLMATSSGPVQIAFGAKDAFARQFIAGLSDGEQMEVQARRSPPAPHGEGRHPVFEFDRWPDSGSQPRAPQAAKADGVRGRVARFNYARHGEINGVVLETGDFLHLKPDGFERAAIDLGDFVEAHGPVQRLADGGGWVVEVQTLNGKVLRTDRSPRPAPR